MNWLVLTTANLDDVMNGDQAELLRSAALGEGQTDRFAAAMQAVCSRIRAMIETGKTACSPVAYSIPPDLADVACYLIVERLQAALPGLALSDDQKVILQDGKDRLKLIEQGKAAVTKPDDGADRDDIDPVIPKPQFGCRHSEFTRRKQDGI